VNRPVAETNGFRCRRRRGSISWIDGKLPGMGEERPECSVP